MAIAIRQPKEIEALREANRIVAETLAYLRELIKPGISLKEIDTLGEEFILKKGAKPSFKGLYGFSGAVCTSVNEVIIHGVPTDYVLQEGDIIGVDLGTQLNGWYGDGAFTCGVGKISEADEKLIACAKDALDFAIDTIRVGMHFKQLSAEIEKFIRRRGFVPLYNFCGHGIGRSPHEEPQIPNYLEGDNPKQGPKIKNGMVFCIEPMICCEDGEAVVLEDEWSVVAKDGRRGSHYEHTLAIVNNRVQVLSKC